MNINKIIETMIGKRRNKQAELAEDGFPASDMGASDVGDKYSSHVQGVSENERHIDIILITAVDDGKNSQTGRSNADLFGDYLNGDLVRVDQHVREGYVPFKGDMFLATVICYNSDEIVSRFFKTSWERPECAQLLIKGKDDDKFTIYDEYTKYLKARLSRL